uniref:Uncharacterized protein n=1 Tax=Rhizophora mucronata TaxID=61149 RepID=A0A2P2PBD1_RHIMU
MIKKVKRKNPKFILLHLPSPSSSAIKEEK